MIIYFFLLCFSFLLGEDHFSSCIASIDNRDISRQEYLYPEQIQSEHFVIHFTVYDQDYQNINGQNYSLESNFGYAQSLLDLAEFSLQKYISDGWELPPPDCDESIQDINSPEHCSNYGGNSLYDIYISNDGPGMVVPERPYNVEPYLGGYSTYMKISTLSNNYTSCPSWNDHVLAHEVHHAVQLRYGSGTSGTSGNYMYNLWFFEQTATYMENVVFPNSIHLRTMLGNCDVVTPLTYPNYGVDYRFELYPYRSALWHKFLVESLGDSSIVKNMWENYGLLYNNSQNQISILPIYNEAIQTVVDDNYSLSDAYNDYSKWRYFTGNRAISNEYFNEASSYCESTISTIDDSFSLLTNNGGSFFIDLPNANQSLVLSTDNPDDIFVSILTNNEDENILIDNINSIHNNFYFNSIDNQSNVLIINTKYSNESQDEIFFNISVNQQNLLGDINFDGFLNVIDIVIIIDFCIGNLTPDSNELSIADINGDNEINVLDIVQLVNLILS